MKIYLIIFLFFIASAFVSAQSEKSITDTLSYNAGIEAVSDTIPNLDIFGDEAPMNLTLKYDITSFIKNKVKGEYLDAKLDIHYKDYSVSKDIRLKARGNNRRQQCFFPPIFLNFKTDPIKTTELKGIKKIKLITHCSTSKAYTNYILKEFLVYKLYNVLTDNSFRVKLLNINYIDTGKKERDYKKYGILIEPLDLLTQRMQSIEIESEVVRGPDVVEESADMVALFQYMIGNTDWRIKGGHNTKYTKSLTEITTKVTAIPYDFDYSALVGTHYSHPQTWTSLDNVQQREYLGYCRNNDEAYLNVIKKFADKEQEFYRVIDSFTYLSERERENVRDYVESFFNEVARPKSLLSTMKAECRDLDF